MVLHTWICLGIAEGRCQVAGLNESHLIDIKVRRSYGPGCGTQA